MDKLGVLWLLKKVLKTVLNFTLKKQKKLKSELAKKAAVERDKNSKKVGSIAQKLGIDGVLMSLSKEQVSTLKKDSETVSDLIKSLSVLAK